MAVALSPVPDGDPPAGNPIAGGRRDGVGSGPVTAFDVLLRPDRYPLSSTYDPAWLLGLDMGPHPLWMLEDLARDLDLRPGMRVLDLGSSPW